MTDTTEETRRGLVEQINSNPKTREHLEDLFGPDEVWDTEQLKAQFERIRFLAPFVACTRKKDGVEGVLMFQHEPRFYFAFREL